MPGIGYTQRARASRQRTVLLTLHRGTGRVIPGTCRAHPLTLLPRIVRSCSSCPLIFPLPRGPHPRGGRGNGTRPPHTPSRRRPWRLSASDASLGRASAKPSQPFRNSGREASSAKASVQPLQILSATVADPQCNRCRSSIRLQSSSTLTSIPSTTFSILGRSRLRNVSMRSPSMKLVASWVFRSVRNSRHF